eukprot:COSAG02_NODE_899_length_16096_cov_19.762956_3_plen_87_part_00
MPLNFFGTDCAQVFTFPSCPNVRNPHGSAGTSPNSIILISTAESFGFRALATLRRIGGTTPSTGLLRALLEEIARTSIPTETWLRL